MEKYIKKKTTKPFKLKPLHRGIILSLLVPISVNANISDNEKVKTKNNQDQSSIEEMVITATEIPTELKRYPGSVTVLENRDLQSTTTTVEAISTVPGVATGSDYGRNIGQRLWIRGFSGNRIIVEQDGIKRDMLIHSTQMSSMRSDNDLLKRVEVTKGSSSISHGSGAIGGVVSLQTKSSIDFIPEGDEFGLATKFRTDSNNYREMYASAAIAPINEKYEFLVYGKRGTEGNLKLSERVDNIEYVDNDEDLYIAFIKGGLQLTDDQKISLSYYNYKNKTEVTWNAMEIDVFPATGPTVGDVIQKDLNTNYTFNPDNHLINFELSAYYSKAEYERRWILNKIYSDHKDKRTGFKLKNQSDFELGDTHHDFVIGADYEYVKEDAIYRRNGVYTAYGSMPNKQKSLGIFVEDHAYLFDDNLMLIFGGRYDKYSSSVTNDNIDYDSHQFSPRLGASYRLVDNLYLLANYSQAFRAPTPVETSSQGPLNSNYWFLPNADLKAERSQEYEAGFSYGHNGLLATDDMFTAKTMFFYGKIKDMIALQKDTSGAISPAGTPYASYKNVDSVTRKGVEVALNYDLYPVGFNLNYEHLKQTDDKTGKRTPNAFADRIQLGVYYYPIDSVKLEIDGRHWFKPHQNPKVNSRGNYFVDKDFTIVDLKASWYPDTNGYAFLGKELELTTGINNLFNSPYVNAADTYPTKKVGKGTNFYLSMSTKF